MFNKSAFEYYVTFQGNTMKNCNKRSFWQCQTQRDVFYECCITKVIKIVSQWIPSKLTILTSSRMDCGVLPASNFEQIKSTKVGSGSPMYSIIFLLIQDWTFFLMVPSISCRSSGWLKRSSFSMGILSMICLCILRFSSCERARSASFFFCSSPSRFAFCFAAFSS